jgi:hypothetical protein
MRSIACRRACPELAEGMVQKEAPFVLLKPPSRRVAFGDAPQDEGGRELQ